MSVRFRALDETLAASKAEWMVSFSSPRKSLTRPRQIISGYLAQEFNDITASQAGLIAPNESQIGEMLDFFRGWNGQSSLIIQCWMGISRSTAAALLASASLFPDQNMEALAQKLRTLSPMATPNALMIGLGDEMLGLQGHLIKSVKNIGRGAEAHEGQPFRLEIAK